MNAIFLVDDDNDVRESLQWMLEAKGKSATGFDSAAAFLDAVDPDQTGVAILDIEMPGMDGLALQQELNRRGSLLSVIILTGHANVPRAVTALKAGALDFLEKPVDGDRLLPLIERGLKASQERQEEDSQAGDWEAKMAQLTERESQLMQLVVEGTTNKEICDKLFIAQRTVEIHRHNLLKKMGVKNAAELAFLVGRNRR
ncbi:Two-component response regulator, FixJ family, consists of REC and HTH domains [Ferrimonas sediminum]|uniref:Two-component response regulator, FixJ family, consists of REC and HTH domains n=1 Tax=Ferrimonas sediminum TaxID=718193 RepID=A0A1G8X7V6_9GAMM|nr:response regulator [Ferrimonas sediminum]SDJ86396.1 Two-component response regulator, FixJ family, consists of REC and HTH domains [Ferrimonas sediminum]